MTVNGTPTRLDESLSIIVPAFNEQERIASTLRAIRDYAEVNGRPCELIVVEDGSRDQTAQTVRTFIDGCSAGACIQVKLLVNESNRGKGYSVRRGMLEATGDWLLMCDADMSVSIEQLETLMAQTADCDIVIASRDLPESVLDPPQPLPRRLAAWVFRALRRRLLLPQIRDTQCGFKLFRREAARQIFEHATIDGWLFDCEALAIAERLGYRIKEVGVCWRHQPGSRVRVWREAFGALGTLRRIRRRVASIPRRH